MKALVMGNSLFGDDTLVKMIYQARHEIEDEEIIFNEEYMKLKKSEKMNMRILNKHLLSSNHPREGVFQLPKVKPYDGPIPDVFLPYNAKVSTGSTLKGVYCNINDYAFNTTWTRPVQALRKVKQYMLAVGPDNTLWVDGSICENVEQRRRSLTIQSFWQNNGVATIQTASWGNAQSILSFAFDGLAENSWTAIGHQRIGSRSEQRLFRYGVHSLVEKKTPIGLLIFGAPLDFDPGVPVIIKPSFISKLRKL